MQFSTVALFAVAASVANAVSTVTDHASTLVTISDCGSTVTSCSLRSTSAPMSSDAPSNTSATVSTYVGAAGVNGQFAAGFAALAAGAMLAL